MKTVLWPVITACVILPHTPLLELDQGQVIGSTLEWQSLVDSLSYRYCLLFHHLFHYSNITLPDWD